MKLQEIHKSILQYASYDDVGLWEIIREISENDFFSPTLPDWVRQKALRVIEELIKVSPGGQRRASMAISFGS